MNYLPLIFALRHLRVRNAESQPPSLMQGDREIPPAPDSRVAAFLSGSDFSGGSMPEAIEMKILTMSCPDWQTSDQLSLAGIVSFGAKDNARAAACARAALAANSKCHLAGQLVNLLYTREDPRMAFGAPDSSAPDVIRLVNAI